MTFDNPRRAMEPQTPPNRTGMLVLMGICLYLLGCVTAGSLSKAPDRDPPPTSAEAASVFHAR